MFSKSVESIIRTLVRPVVLFALTGTTVYLALGGNEKAIEALLLQFIAVLAFYFGERAGASIPQANKE